MLNICWQEHGAGVTASTITEICAILEDLATDTSTEKGIGLILEKPSGQVLTVIIAGECWALDWFPEDYNGVGSYHTIADEYDPEIDYPINEPEIVTFYFMGHHHSEIPLLYTLEKQRVLAGIEEFSRSASLPACLRWELD